MPAQNPDADILITVTNFVEYTDPTAQCSYDIAPFDNTIKPGKDSDGKKIWKMGRVSLHIGQYQKDGGAKPTTVRLEPPHPQGVFNHQATIKFRVLVAKKEAREYFPVGMTFLRADDTVPKGVPYTTGKHQDPFYAFQNVELNEVDNTIEIELHQTNHDPATGKDGQHATHRTYRFQIFIMERSTGRIGLIDPEIEDPNAR